MADQRYVALAAQYTSEEEAVADFEALLASYDTIGKRRSFDAAVVVRDAGGKVSIPRRDDSGAHRGAGKGLVVGIAAGVVATIFPAVLLGGALLAAGGAGAGIGAIAGHISKKSSEKELKALSESLHAGSAGIVVVAAPEQADAVQQRLTHATGITRSELALDPDELDAAAPTD